MEKLNPIGKCVFCEKTFAKRSITRHLGTHLKNLPPEAKKKSFHLRIDDGHYYLNLLVDGDTSLGTLDDYLRKIWLECCGHLSQFSFGAWEEELSMGTPMRRLLSPGAKLWYAYDFGSTSELDIKTVSELPVATPEGIRLLSRNEPLEIWCQTCKKEPATSICSVHWGEGDYLFCDGCTDAHEEKCEDAEYALLPIVNSPRFGVCAYNGGTIDIERDGIFSPKR